VDDSKDFEALRQGVELATRDFKRILDEEGLKEIGTAGEVFDPQMHEAVDIEESEEENKVSKIIDKGYMYKEKIIKPAKVSVTKKRQEF
jgi:molecular chaperone GrpE